MDYLKKLIFHCYKATEGGTMADFSDRCHLSNWEGWNVFEQMLKENEQERSEMSDQELRNRFKARIVALDAKADQLNSELGMPHMFQPVLLQWLYGEPLTEEERQAFIKRLKTHMPQLLEETRLIAISEKIRVDNIRSLLAIRLMNVPRSALEELFGSWEIVAELENED